MFALPSAKLGIVFSLCGALFVALDYNARRIHSFPKAESFRQIEGA